MPLSLIYIREDPRPTKNAGCNHLPETFGSLCIMLSQVKCNRDLFTHPVVINRE